MPEPRGDLLFFQNNLPTDFVSHGGRLVSNKSLLSLSYARARIEFWVTVSRDCAREDTGNEKAPIPRHGTLECGTKVILILFFLVFFFFFFLIFRPTNSLERVRRIFSR